jgi:hypothetical protein
MASKLTLHLLLFLLRIIVKLWLLHASLASWGMMDTQCKNTCVMQGDGMRFSAIVLAFGLMAMTGTLRAADGSSGCGPGWYILKKNSMLSSVGRFITNTALFPLSTLGMTLGTSNCSKHSLVEEHKRSLHFATLSYDLLRQDMARGSGRLSRDLWLQCPGPPESCWTDAGILSK